jgi:hypothetical protein
MRKYLSRKAIARLTLSVILSVSLFGCDMVDSPSNLVDIVSVDADAKWDGLIATWHPMVKIKFKNKSGWAISKPIAVKYQFIIENEVVEEGKKMLHEETDPAWESGLYKTLDFDYWSICALDSMLDMKSMTQYKSGKLPITPPRISAKIVFEDNSLIWEGKFEPLDFRTYSMEKWKKLKR